MFKSFTKMALAVAALTMSACIGAASAEDAKIKHMSFKITIPYKSDINVISSDGKRWDTILPTTIPLWADTVVDTKHPGYVERAGVFLGTCSGSSCGKNPRLKFWSPMERDWKFHGYFNFDTGEIPVSTDGIATVSLGDEVLKRCNLAIPQTGGTSFPHSFDHEVTLSLSVNTRKAQLMSQAIVEGGDGFHGGDANDRTTFSMRVNCIRFHPIGAPPKPASVDIRVKQKGDTCPKDAEVTAYIDYDKPMTGRFRVIHNGKQGKIIEIKARKMSFVGKTFYRIERLERYKLNPGTHSFKIKVIGAGESDTKSIDVDCPPFKVTSTWLTYKVEDKDACPKQVEEVKTINVNGPGDVPFRVETEAGLVVDQGIAYTARKGDRYVAVRKRKFTVGEVDQLMRLKILNDGSVGWTQTQLKVDCVYKPSDAGASTDLVPETRPEDPPPVHPTLTGDFSFIDNGGTKCPRQDKALINFKTSTPDNVHWSLDCTNGHFSGVAQTVASPKGGYIAPALVKFDVNQTTHAKCVLKTVAPGKAKIHTLKDHIFQCVKRTDVGGPEDLTPDTRPDPQKPDKPDKVVDPVKPDKPKPDKPGTAVVDPSRPTISCANGVVRNGACECEPTMKPVKAGKNAWRCVLDPKPEKPIVSEPKITCAKGRVKNGACTCDRMHKVVKTGRNTWACVKVVVDLPRNKANAKVEVKTDEAKAGVKTAPKKMAAPKLGNADKVKGGKGKGKGKTAKKGNGSSTIR